jgi:transposase
MRAAKIRIFRFGMKLTRPNITAHKSSFMEISESNYVSPGRYSVTGYYDVRFIKEVVQQIEDGLPRQEALLTYGLKKFTLHSWIRKYASSQYLDRRKIRSAQTKRSVVRAIAEGRMNIGEAMTACNVRAAKTIRLWVARDKQENDDLAASNLSALNKKKSSHQSAAVNAEVKALQQQLADAQLKIAALNTLIDVAEEQLKINIRKKPGAKQS